LKSSFHIFGSTALCIQKQRCAYKERSFIVRPPCPPCLVVIIILHDPVSSRSKYYFCRNNINSININNNVAMSFPSFLQPQQQQPAASSMPSAASDGNSNSYFEGSFDYRSLLPVGGGTGASRQSFANTTGNDNYDNNDMPGGETCGCLPALTWRERYLGCGVCMVAGYLLSMGSLWRLGALLTGHPLPFVFNATVGNLLALAGSCFLMGPSAQFNRMWQEQRRTATAAYLGSVVLTLIVAFWKGLFLQGLWLIVLMLIQFVAITWYCLSYIPYAQDAVLGYVSRVMQRNEY
jgi:hypothetical protein